MATTVRVMKTAGYTRVAIEHCIVAMLPRSAVKDLDRAASKEGLYRSAFVRAMIMRYLQEPTSTASDEG